MRQVKAILRERHVTLDQFAGLLNAAGVRTRQGTEVTPPYLSQLLTGYRSPSWQFATGIARVVKEQFGHDIEVASLMAPVAPQPVA